MNELKATPGPWSVGTKVKTMVFASDGLDLVADCTAGEFTRDVEVANAALIAASPTMYQALKEALECLADVAANKGGWDWEAVLQDGEEALKKARGE